MHHKLVPWSLAALILAFASNPALAGPTGPESVPMTPQSLEEGLVLYRTAFSFGTVGVLLKPDGTMEVLAPSGWKVRSVDQIRPFGTCPCHSEVVYDDGYNVIVVVVDSDGNIVATYVLQKNRQ